MNKNLKPSELGMSKKTAIGEFLVETYEVIPANLWNSPIYFFICCSYPGYFRSPKFVCKASDGIFETVLVPRPGFTSQILVSFHGKVVSATELAFWGETIPSSLEANFHSKQPQKQKYSPRMEVGWAIPLASAFWKQLRPSRMKTCCTSAPPQRSSCTTICEQKTELLPAFQLLQIGPRNKNQDCH